MAQMKAPVRGRREAEKDVGGHRSISKAKAAPSKRSPRPAQRFAPIDGQASLDKAADALLATGCKVAAELVRVGGRPPLRLRAPGFSGFAAIIVSQQVSVASANAIFARLEARFTPLDGAAIRAADDDSVRACGLSRPKVRALRALAEAEGAGLDLAGLGAIAADEAHRRLTAIWGVGPWSADIFLLFCLGHPDAFPSGDLALQEAARMAMELPERPDAKGLERIAERWRPYRGVAARMLWAYYRVAKGGAGMALAQAAS